MTRDGKGEVGFFAGHEIQRSVSLWTAKPKISTETSPESQYGQVSMKPPNVKRAQIEAKGKYVQLGRTPAGGRMLLKSPSALIG